MFTNARRLWCSLAIVCAIAIGWQFGHEVIHAATCVGATPCKACSNCKSCAHCNKKRGTCGVCKKGTE